MKIELNELTGTEKQIAYANDLRKKAVIREAYLIGAYEDQAEEILADSDYLDEVIASGALGDMKKSEITLTFIVSSLLENSTSDDPKDTKNMQNLGKALTETSAHAVIELLK